MQQSRLFKRIKNLFKCIQNAFPCFSMKAIKRVRMLFSKFTLIPLFPNRVTYLNCCSLHTQINEHAWTWNICVTLTWKSPWKSCSIAHRPFLSPNPKILKAFLKTLPTKMKPTKRPAREKKMRREKRKKKGGEKAKSKSQDCCVTLKPKFCFLRMPELRKLIFCIWIRRPRSVRPVNRFVVSFSAL